MQLVINISEEIYKRTLPYKNEPIFSDYSAFIHAVANGTPLPKGHGRLIDVDYLRKDFKASKRISFAERMDISCIVDHAPIIIEADRSEEDG